jgi:hypothetical protein
VIVASTSDKNSTDARMRATLAAVAPGTELREGLERILRGRTGALLVLGQDKTVDSISTGGFEIDVEFTATGLRELSKMDGAIILDRDISKMLRAAVHLMPDPSIHTEETGTRHRTADRVARQTGFPVISVSQSMHIIALYVDDQRYVLEDSGAILSRANQALATLERYKLRLDEVSGTLSALEIEDLVTVRDVAAGAWRWCAGSPPRSTGTSSSSAPMAGCSPSSSTNWSRAWPVNASSSSGITCPRPRGAARRQQTTYCSSSTPSARLICWTSARSLAPCSSVAPSSWTRPSPRAGTGCWPRCRGCPVLSSTG